MRSLSMTTMTEPMTLTDSRLSRDAMPELVQDELRTFDWIEKFVSIPAQSLLALYQTRTGRSETMKRSSATDPRSRENRLGVRLRHCCNNSSGWPVIMTRKFGWHFSG